MELPEIHTAEDLALLSPAEQLDYAKELAAAAVGLLELARDSVTVPAGASGAVARAYYNSLVQAAQNARHMVGPTPMPYSGMMPSA